MPKQRDEARYQLVLDAARQLEPSGAVTPIRISRLLGLDNKSVQHIIANLKESGEWPTPEPAIAAEQLDQHQVEPKERKPKKPAIPIDSPEQLQAWRDAELARLTTARDGIRASKPMPKKTMPLKFGINHRASKETSK